jgi:hypothetical protein
MRRRSGERNLERGGYILASDVWTIPKSLEPMSAQEERAAWRKTVKVLGGLCGMSDALMLDPLILALTDTLMRSVEHPY